MNIPQDYLPVILSIIPLIVRAIINFSKEEKAVTNNRKNLLNQIRVALSLEFSRNLHFENAVVQINDDFRSKLREYMNDFLYTNTSVIADFNLAIKKCKCAITWIRFFKYSLVVVAFLSFALFVLSKLVVEFTPSWWYGYFLFAVFTLVVFWFCRERAIDTFNNMCVKYEIERNE